jgi:NAD(P)-dependent dehydrogenase (short-subunit alcohol dehydrogenase family)
MNRLAGKIVMITGAARGQGAAGAVLLAARGAHAITTDVSPPAGLDAPGVVWRRLDVRLADGCRGLATPPATAHAAPWQPPGTAPGPPILMRLVLRAGLIVAVRFNSAVTYRRYECHKAPHCQKEPH